MVEKQLQQIKSNKGELQIKAESLPERCEVCHQTDCFDPVNNHCTRCAGVSVTVPSSLSNSGPYIEAVNQARQVKTGGTMALLCIITNILVWGSFNRLTVIGMIVAVMMLLRGLNILRILRKVNSSDPDWMITRKRILTGILTSTIAGIAGIIWILIWLFTS